MLMILLMLVTEHQYCVPVAESAQTNPEARCPGCVSAASTRSAASEAAEFDLEAAASAPSTSAAAKQATTKDRQHIQLEAGKSWHGDGHTLPYNFDVQRLKFRSRLILAEPQDQTGSKSSSLLCPIFYSQPAH